MYQIQISRDSYGYGWSNLMKEMACSSDLKNVLRLYCDYKKYLEENYTDAHIRIVRYKA